MEQRLMKNIMRMVIAGSVVAITLNIMAVFG